MPSTPVICLDPSLRPKLGVRWDTCGGSGPDLAGFANIANFEINGANAWEAESKERSASSPLPGLELRSVIARSF